MVSRFERSDGGPDFIDDADAFMTENAAGLARRDVTLENVQIGAANCRFGHFDDRVRGSRDIRLGPVFEGLLSWPLINECFHRPCCYALIAGCWFWRCNDVHGCHLSGELIVGSGRLLSANRER